MDHWTFGLTGLPWSVSSTWVRPHHTCATDLRAIHCALALHPFICDPLNHPSGSATATTLGHLSSPSVLWTNTLIEGGRRCGSVAVARAIVVTPSPRTFGYAVGSHSIAVIASGRHHGDVSAVVLLSSFPEDGTPLVDFCDFNIHLEKPYAAEFHSLHSVLFPLGATPSNLIQCSP